MKYLLTSIVLGLVCVQMDAQNQLEILLPVGLSEFTPATYEAIRQSDPEKEWTFTQGISTGAMLRYTFNLQNKFHIAASAGYQLKNVNYKINEEIRDPAFLNRNSDISYTDHSIAIGLNYRYRLIEDGNQALALQAKTHLGIPFAGSFNTIEERQFGPDEEPQKSERTQSGTIYLEDFNAHLNLGAGIIYTYHFSKFAIFGEANYMYGYHLIGRSDAGIGSNIDWQNLYLGLGIGYAISGQDKIEGNQDAFFRK